MDAIDLDCSHRIPQSLRIGLQPRQDFLLRNDNFVELIICILQMSNLGFQFVELFGHLSCIHIGFRAEVGGLELPCALRFSCGWRSHIDEFDLAGLDVVNRADNDQLSLGFQVANNFAFFPDFLNAMMDVGVFNLFHKFFIV